MKSEQDIRDKIEFLKAVARYWYKQNKNPNRIEKRGQCVLNRNLCLKEIKTLQWVLEEQFTNEVLNMSKTIIGECKECGEELYLPYYNKNLQLIPANFKSFNDGKILRCIDCCKKLGIKEYTIKRF